ncbi:hypothetical protein N566_11875 [Streptomycetaceae bacterium MP113-05]|nr:hypothetical protein N566_11875 [Streptomycetaceae bacterium MP113-05]
MQSDDVALGSAGPSAIALCPVGVLRATVGTPAM